MPDTLTSLKRLLYDILLFCEHGTGTRLRSYQEQVARAIVDSVTLGKGLTFVVIFPRQSGKNELQAQIETYLLTLLCLLPAELVKISPTWKPQSLNAMRRLERVLKNSVFSHQVKWHKEQGYIYRVRDARIYFLSGSPSANIVGATASTLLECDEAQDVTIQKWDKEINPMAASANATRVFWGTAWTSNTLLAREKRAALQAQEEDGIQRVFEIDADRVRQEVPAYGTFVDGEIAKLGRNHPFVRTQYFSEEIEAIGGMFTPYHLALIAGDHPHRLQPLPDETYAFLVDVGGESDQDDLESPKHDATALTIIQIDTSTIDDDLIHAPTYQVVQRRLWIGESQPSLYAQIKALADLWQPNRIAIDATGLGAGLASFLSKSLPGQVLPFVFTAKSKSDLGWSFLSVIETGRFKDYKQEDELQEIFQNQLLHLQMEVMPGPAKLLRWSVPDGTRNLATGELVYDDLAISAALCTLLDAEQWGSAKSAIITGYDPLDDMSF